MAFGPIELRDADLAFDPAWLDPIEADELRDVLRAQIPWETHRIRLFGHVHGAPRLSCWIGDPGTDYRYSRTLYRPHPWPPRLLALRARLERDCGARFDSVLANRYRDGRDCMGWHSDDEPELGPAPVIASLSLGETRRFVLRHRFERGLRHELELMHGSLLLMRGRTQAHWQHALPRTARVLGERLNLTFRCVRARPPRD